MFSYYYPTTQAHNARFELNKDMNFSAAHYIPFESAGVCSRVHGHTYEVNVTIIGNELDETGMLVNFKTLKDLVHGRYDHRLLNDLDEFNSEKEHAVAPSTERLAEFIWNTIDAHLSTLPNRPFCSQIIVRETPTSYVIYRPAPDKFM